MKKDIDKEVEICDCCEVHENLLQIVNETIPEENELYDLAELFKVFGDSTRIRILFVLLAVPVWGIRSYLWGILVSQAVTALLSIFILLRKTAGYTFGRNNIKTQK